MEFNGNRKTNENKARKNVDKCVRAISKLVELLYLLSCN